MRTHPTALAGALLLILVGCSPLPRAPEVPTERATPLAARRALPAALGDETLATPSIEAPWCPPFTFLAPVGRDLVHHEVVTVTWSYDGTDAPFPDTAVIPVIEEVATEWARTGVVRFVRGNASAAAAAGRPGIIIGWRLGDHGGCPPFLGWDGGLAHATDPTYRGLGFIHLNAGFRWTLEEDPPPERPRPGPQGVSLRRPSRTHFRTVLLHEFGHNLGLGHSLDPASIMAELYAWDGTGAATKVRAPRITAADAAGVHSGYGGGRAAASDLEILAVTGEGALVPFAPPLRRFLPAEHMQWDAFDADGDGRDELVSWPRSAAVGTSTVAPMAHGVYVAHFDASGWLERLEGPMIGMLDPTRAPLVRPGTGPQSPGALGVRRRDGAVTTLRFTPDGLPLEVARPSVDPVPPWREGGAFRESSLGDLDGDGRPDILTRDPSAPEASSSASEFRIGPRGGAPLVRFRAESARAADLDGDGVPELLVRGRTTADPMTP